MSYEPRPVEVTAESIPAGLRPLMEKLAANAHEVWSRARLDQGWTWGPVRDDARRQHPCLVPYDQLPEEEKVHDRNAVAGALAAIRHAGWQLLPPAGLDGIDPAEVASADAAALRRLWEARADDEVHAYPLDDYTAISRRAMRLGELLLACDAALGGLRHYPDDAGLHRLVARAQAEMGRHHRARLRVEQLVARGHHDPETFGLLGRTLKDEGFALRAAGLSPDDAWQRSAAAYGEAFARHVDYFTGINAATMTYFSGDLEEAAALAARVDALAAAALDAEPADHWAMATRGEAALLQQRWDEAAGHYRRATAGLSKRSADLASMGRQARRVLHEWSRHGLDTTAADAWFHEIFPQADVVLFSGHRFDAADRDPPRFPARCEPAVAAALRAWLEHHGTQVVYTSLSTGADLLMAEAALDAGVSLRLVLPKPAENLDGGPLQDRLMRVHDRADALTVLGDGSMPDDPNVFAHCNHVLAGLALLDAEAAGTGVRGLAVWNQLAGDGGGGTADCVAEWCHAGIGVDRIDPLTGRPGDLPVLPAVPESADRGEGLVVRAMLFADVKGYSKLDETELHAFTRAFRADLAGLVADGHAACEVLDTWGDGVFMVFREVDDAARAALAFRDAVAGRDWRALGIGMPLGVRVALHAGPVKAWANDPLSGRPQFCGRNIARAARIEPITEVNEVYASDGFAALLKRRNPADLRLDYVGSVPLAKKYGRQRLFRLAWIRGSDGENPGTEGVAALTAGGRSG